MAFRNANNADNYGYILPKKKAIYFLLNISELLDLFSDSRLWALRSFRKRFLLLPLLSHPFPNAGQKEVVFPPPSLSLLLRKPERYAPHPFPLPSLQKEPDKFSSRFSCFRDFYPERNNQKAVYIFFQSAPFLETPVKFRTLFFVKFLRASS